MTANRQRCLFCYAENRSLPTLSREHLLSKPVARAFAIDRTSPILRLDDETQAMRWGRLDGISRKCVCRDCNSGWMNRLEDAMASVSLWLAGDPNQALGETRNLTLRRWAIKTHMLLCYIDGNAARFGDESFPDEVVVPPVTPARQMYEDDTDTLDGAAVGVSRSAASTRFVWSFGFPTVKAVGPGQGHARFAPASVLTLGSLQLWVVVPLLDAEISAPRGVVSCSPRVRAGDLVELAHPRNVKGLVVNFD